MICENCLERFKKFITHLTYPELNLNPGDNSDHLVLIIPNDEDLKQSSWLHCHCLERSMPELMGFEPYVDPDRKKD